MIPSCKRKTEALRQRHGCSYREEVQVSSPSASQKAEHRKKRKRRGESGRETHFCLPLASAPPELLIKPPPICLLGAEQSRMERTQGLDFNPASYNSVWSQASCYWLSESCFHICNTRLSVPRVVLWELKGEGTVPRVGAGPTLMPQLWCPPNVNSLTQIQCWYWRDGEKSRGSLPVVWVIPDSIVQAGPALQGWFSKGFDHEEANQGTCDHHQTSSVGKHRVPISLSMKSAVV